MQIYQNQILLIQISDFDKFAFAFSLLDRKRTTEITVYLIKLLPLDSKLLTYSYGSQFYV